MKLNSDKAVEAGRRLVQAYGDWDNVRRHAIRQPDGSLRVPSEPPTPVPPPRGAANGG